MMYQVLWSGVACLLGETNLAHSGYHIMMKSLKCRSCSVKCRLGAVMPLELGCYERRGPENRNQVDCGNSRRENK